MTCWLTIIGTSIILLWIGTAANVTPGANDGQNLPVDDPSMHVDDGQSTTESTNQELGSEKKAVCLTEGCKHTASKYLQQMNLSVNPCDNFYEFACGRILNSTSPFDDGEKYSFYHPANDQVNRVLKTVAEAEIDSDEPKPFKLVKILYKSCMNEDVIEARGLEPIRKIFDKYGGWPVLDGDSWNETNFNWTKLINQLSKDGLFPYFFLNLRVKRDTMNNTKPMIEIRPVTLSLPVKVLRKGLSNKYVADYYNAMINVSVLMGANKSYAQKELEDAVHFQMKLAEISLSSDELQRENELEKPTTLKQLIENHPLVPWKDYFTEILMSSGIDINNDTIVNVTVPGYIEKFENLMSITSKRVLANYAMGAIINELEFTLNNETRGNFPYKVHSGATRWRDCMLIVRTYLDSSLNVMYLRRYVNKTVMANIDEVLTNIQQQMKKNIDENDGLDEQIKHSALEKASKIENILAFIGADVSDEQMEEYYENLEFSEDNYLENMINMFRFRNNIKFGESNKSAKKDWILDNYYRSFYAVYDLDENIMFLGSALLHGDSFSVDRPKYLNYGSLGITIGHEIIQGFDFYDGKHNGDGNITNWWTSYSREKLRQRARCINNQNKNYMADEFKIYTNDTKIQDLNVVDYGSFKLAYQAYINRADKNVQELALPKLDYTPNQMFWISYASTLRGTYQSEAKFRVLNSLSNSNEFSNDFQCPPDSKMNRSDKCSLW